jgi:hypothetical protein
VCCRVTKDDGYLSEKEKARRVWASSVLGLNARRVA